MAPRFVDAHALFRSLLDRHEAGVERPLAYPDHDAFADVASADRFARAVIEARDAGLVEVRHETGLRRSIIRNVRLVDAEGLYRRLGHRPTTVSAVEARANVFDGLALHPAIGAAAEAAFAAWSRRAAWCGLGIDAVAEMRNALRLAQAFVDGRACGLDYRTFSQRAAGDSKALERLETAVLRLIAGAVDLPAAGRPRSVFAAMGLGRIGTPILLAGPIALSAGAPEVPTAYVGIPPEEIGALRFVRPPSYVLTIENMVSYIRHVSEADPERDGLTIFVGGFPSLGIQAALAHLGAILPDTVPFFHWSDIDPAGVQIFLTVEAASRRPLQAHLMSVELAERHGTRMPAASKLTIKGSQGSAVAGLADYLLGPDAKTVEQEAMDPALPNAFDEAARYLTRR